MTERLMILGNIDYGSWITISRIVGRLELAYKGSKTYPFFAFVSSRLLGPGPLIGKKSGFWLLIAIYDCDLRWHRQS